MSASSAMAMVAHDKYSKVGPYILMETIGVGSFGKVKLAVHDTSYKRFACKILDKTLVRERVLSLQVQKEIEIMQCLSHRNTVSLVSVLSTSSKVFIVMELVTGGELFDEILRHKRLSEPYARFYFRQLMEGLQHCHDHGVYHRDLKPENLLLDDNGTLKITDFGLSTLKAGPSSASTASVTDSLTLHTQCGTPNYVAPEIITLNADGYSGAKVDAWSCGIILYVLVAGALPFDANEMDVLFKLILRCDLTYPSFFSSDLVDLISNLLKTNPAERYSLADVMRHAWYNGPVESSMPAEDNPLSSVLSPAIVAPASLLADSVCNARDINAPNDALPPSDSLDFGLRVEPAECELPPAATVTATNSSSESTAETDPRDDHDREGSPDSAVTDDEPMAPHQSFASYKTSNITPTPARPLMRLLEEELTPYGQSSDDDHDYDFEEAKEVRAPDGFFSPKQRVLAVQPGGRDADFPVRRVCSLSNMASSTSHDASSNDGALASAPLHAGAHVPGIERAEGYVGMRGRVKRQLWDRAAKTWQLPSQSYYPAWSNDTRREFLDHRAELAMDNGHMTAYPDYQRPASGGVDANGGSGIRKSTSAAGENANHFVRILEQNESIEAKAGYAVPRPQPKPTGSLVRARSYDGPLPSVPTRRRPRRSAHRGAITSGSSGVVGKDRLDLTQERARRTAAAASERMPDASGRTPRRKMAAERPQRRVSHGAPGVRFRKQEQQRHRKGSSFRPDEAWVETEADRMVWCLLMKDFNMIPDELEFGVDSATLSDMWKKGLAKEGIGRKSSFAASRFGSPTFVPSRSTVALSSAARGAQREGKNATSNVTAAPRRSRAVRSRRAATAVSHKPGVVGGSVTSRRSTPSATGSPQSVQESADLRSVTIDSGQTVPVHRKEARPTTPAAEKQVRLSAITEPEDEIRPNLPPAVHVSRATAMHGAPERSTPSPLRGSTVIGSSVATGMPIPTRLPPPATRNGLLSTMDDDSISARRYLEGSSPPDGSSGRMSPAYIMRSGGSGPETSTFESSSGSIMQQMDKPWVPSPAERKAIPGDGSLLLSSMHGDRLPVNKALKTADEIRVMGLLQQATVNSQRIACEDSLANADESDGQRTASSAYYSNGHHKRSDGRSLASDRGTMSSAAESTSSTVLRSGGSDGMMSTPRDPDKSYSGQVNEDRIHTVLSSGASSVGSDMDASRKNSSTKSKELMSSLAKGAHAPLPFRTDGSRVFSIRSASASQVATSSGSVSPRDGVREPVCPFSVEIPGPKATTLPTAKRSLLPTVSTAKKFLRKSSLPLDVKSYTQFHSLLDPRRCYELMLELLRSYGCTGIKGSPHSSGKFKIKCESVKDDVPVVASISFYKLDDDLCAVSFKKKGNCDTQKFIEFYEGVHRLYCEKSSDELTGNSTRDESSDGPRRRSKRNRTHRVHFPAYLNEGTGTNTGTSQSARSGQGSSVRSESSDSGVSSRSATRKKKSMLAFVTQSV